MAQYLLLNLEDENAHATQAPKAMADLIDQRAASNGAELRGIARGGVHCNS